jgi:hypothetical protein
MTCRYAPATASTTRSREFRYEASEARTLSDAERRFLNAVQSKIVCEAEARASVYPNGPTIVGPKGILIPSAARFVCCAVSERLPVTFGSRAVATAVSFVALGAQKHFPSDIFVGSVRGGLIGNYVATRAGGF